MRIGINGRFLVAKQTGVQRAAYNLVTSLVKIDRDNEYFLFTGHDETERPEWNLPNVHVIADDLREGHTLRNLIWEQVKLPRLARRYGIDILHSPANMAPLFYAGRSVIHIHDLCFVVNPEWYSFSFRTWYNFVIPRLARRATKVITNSNNSCNDLLQFCNLPAEKVSLVHWAVDQAFLSTKPMQPIDMPDPYILYVGSLEPRKNIKSLVRAFEKLRFDHPDLQVKLILIGGESPLFADIGLTIKDFKEDIILKGFVDDEVLRSYYRQASLVAYPSLYEGFGLPPLEAMASGVPVVTSNTSSLPEVVGDAALMVDPMDVENLSRAMAEVLLNETLRQSMVDKGLRQVQKFSWQRVARNVMATYYEVFHGGDQVAKGQPAYLPFGEWKKLADLET